jgi:hypothetical protein
VVVPGVDPELFVNDPVLGLALHTALVAPPPNEPPNAAVAPPWHIALSAPPALTVGFGFTTKDLLAEVVPHDPPVVVKVNVTGLDDDDDAVYVVVPGVLPLLLVNVPPAPPSLHTAPVALPPKEPPSAGVVPPWQIALNAPPTPTVGAVTLVTVTPAVAVQPA